ncbi:MAG TPA: hypothetical protein VH583_14040 [Vicinamibacterales bacterium]|jgi:hypothetical protein
MSSSSVSIGPLVHHIRAEYLESPGLRLTANQIQRMWRLDATQCESVLAALIDSRFLRRTSEGEFVRID